ncbi:PTS transporter subunit EIIB [Mannheimia indoligenes]|uniref:PTS transporter subunit EIIB n=1 Tax=Mannheimia indoligenes TaxID=3103145 RepID=UPI002FE635C9
MSNSLTDKALVVIAALGGRENIVDVYACITRLRVEVKNTQIVEWDKIKSVGALGVVTSGTVIQSIFGSEAEHYRDEIKRILNI